MRFEIKVIKMQYLKTKNVPLRYLSDLLNMSIYEPLGNILTEVFEGILFGDNTLDEKRLTAKELETYLRGSNPKTWEVSNAQHSEWKKLQRLEFSFKDILEQHRTGVNFRSVVSELIRAKSLEMSTFYQVEESVLKLENVHFLPTENQDEKMQNVHFLHFSYSVNSGQTDNSITTSSTPVIKPKIKLCSGCGKPIERDRKYHSIECEQRRIERNDRSNTQHNFRKKYFNNLDKIKLMPPTLFGAIEPPKLTEQQNEWINKELKKNYRKNQI